MKVNNKSYVGVDLSYTSPAFTVYNETSNQYFCYYLTKVKKCQGTFTKDNFTFIGKPSYEGVLNGSERYKAITDWIVETIQNNHPEALDVLIEGYSMNSRGSRTFEIGENAGMLKYALMSAGYTHIIKSPREIKKFACGNGGVGKYSMEVFFKKNTNIEIRDIILSKAENPVSDIIDSYWMCEMMRSYSS